MGKHAYLIMAHKNDYTFHTLLKLLDDERNTIFIHMDVKVNDYDPAAIRSMLTKSCVIHTPSRWDIQWGGDRQIFLELMLLETAVSHGKFDFYHLISGQDIPIKSQDEIHTFFDSHPNTEFIEFMEGDYSERVRYYHSLQNKLGKKEGFLSHVNGLYIRIQKIIGIYRNKNISFAKGSNWFSITDACANYVLSKKAWIRKVFHSTNCADELFLQTVLLGTEFYHRRYRTTDGEEKIYRYIDWSDTKSESPRIYNITDKENLAGSDDMFARKFDCQTDSEIIDYVAQNLASAKI